MNNKPAANAADTNERPPNRKQTTMKTLTKLALAALMLTTAVASRADWVSGHFRSNGTYVMPYYRTPANGIPYDNLSYRGYPSQQPGYISPRTYGLDSGFSRPAPLPCLDSDLFGKASQRHSSDLFDGGLQTMPNLNRSYRTSTYGF